MTIAAGFRVRDGILVCSDSEHSAGGILTHESKLTPAEFEWGKVIFASAGNADLAQAAIEQCIHKLRSMETGRIASNSDASRLIERTVNAEYRKHVCAQPDPESASVYEILAAVWCQKEPTKKAAPYRTWQGIINNVDGYHCIGSGYYLGRYVIESMAAWALFRNADIENARVVATRTLSIAKKFVSGCGGNSHMAFLTNDGAVIGSTTSDAEPLEQALEIFEDKTMELLFAVLTGDDASFAGGLSDFSKKMSKLRADFRLDDKSKDELLASLRETPTPGSTKGGP